MKVFHRSRATNCGKLRLELGRRNRFGALASTHHWRYVREERATPLLRLFPPVHVTSRAECRAAGCALFPNEYSDVVWFPTRLYYKAFAETRPCLCNRRSNRR
jgi:hypothetical protein